MNNEVDVDEENDVMEQRGFEVEFEEGLQKIAPFAMCMKAVTKLELPRSLTHIGRDAFYNCRKLQSVVVGEKLKIIDDFVFCNCSSLRSLRLENNRCLTKIGTSAFYGCALTELRLPQSICHIGPEAFRGNKYLKYVQFEDGSCIETIGKLCFADCVEMKRLSLPLGGLNLRRIHVGAFSATLRAICIRRIYAGNPLVYHVQREMDPMQQIVIAHGRAYDSETRIESTMWFVVRCIYASCPEMIRAKNLIWRILRYWFRGHGTFPIRGTRVMQLMRERLESPPTSPCCVVS